MEEIQIPEAELRFEPLPLESMLMLIDGPNGVACRQIYEDHKALIDTAPGASNNHHTWEGGYRHHVEQVMNTFRQLYATAKAVGHIDQLPESEKFNMSDGLTIMWLHDLEKPFKYSLDEDGKLVDNPELKDKEARKNFRQEMIDRYGIALNPEQQNALLHVEGVRDKYYTPSQRVDHPLAVLCHMADLYSARILYDYAATW